MSKTIKELADELGVSKQTIRYHLKHLPANYTGKDSKNRIIIKPNAETVIKGKVVKEKTSITGKHTGNISVNKNGIPVKGDNEYQALINKRLDNLEKLYHEQLTSKDEEIKRLHDTLNHNQKLLDQSQQLQLIAENKIKQLEEPKKEAEKSEQSEPSREETTKKKSFWSIFKQNDN